MPYIQDLSDPYFVMLSSSMPCASFQVEVGSKACQEIQVLSLWQEHLLGGNGHFHLYPIQGYALQLCTC